jgi:hypothetical protein
MVKAPNLSSPLGSYPTVDEAKRAAQDHSDQQSGVEPSQPLSSETTIATDVVFTVPTADVALRPEKPKEIHLRTQYQRNTVHKFLALLDDASLFGRSPQLLFNDFVRLHGNNCSFPTFKRELRAHKLALRAKV